MTAEDFVKAVKAEKDVSLELYFSENYETLIGSLINGIIENGATIYLYRRKSCRI